MTDVFVPADGHTERTVVACAALGPTGAEMAGDVVSAEDFRADPRNPRLFTAALGEQTAGYERVAEVAARAGVPQAYLARCLADSPVQFDLSGSRALHLRRLSRGRDLMVACADTYRLLGAGPFTFSQRTTYEQVLRDGYESVARCLVAAGWTVTPPPVEPPEPDRAPPMSTQVADGTTNATLGAFLAVPARDRFTHTAPDYPGSRFTRKRPT